jgi:hypothetical protein
LFRIKKEAQIYKKDSGKNLCQNDVQISSGFDRRANVTIEIPLPRKGATLVQEIRMQVDL